MLTMALRWFLWFSCLAAFSHGLSLRHSRHQSGGIGSSPTAEEILGSQASAAVDDVFARRAADAFGGQDRPDKRNENHRRMRLVASRGARVYDNGRRVQTGPVFQVGLPRQQPGRGGIRPGRRRFHGDPDDQGQGPGSDPEGEHRQASGRLVGHTVRTKTDRSVAVGVGRCSGVDKNAMNKRRAKLRRWVREVEGVERGG